MSGNLVQIITIKLKVCLKRVFGANGNNWHSKLGLNRLINRPDDDRIKLWPHETTGKLAN